MQNNEFKLLRKAPERTHITDELEVCIVPAGAKHCGVVHLKHESMDAGEYQQKGGAGEGEEVEQAGMRVATIGEQEEADTCEQKNTMRGEK